MKPMTKATTSDATLEKQIEKLEKTIARKDELIKQRDRKIREQNRLIKKHQIGKSPITTLPLIDYSDVEEVTISHRSNHDNLGHEYVEPEDLMFLLQELSGRLTAQMASFSAKDLKGFARSTRWMAYELQNEYLETPEAYRDNVIDINSVA